MQREESAAAAGETLRGDEMRIGATAGADQVWSRPGVLLPIVGVGILVRLWQWLGDGSLWLDEISLARNIHALSLHELLTERLAFDQVAPRGFLAAVKLSTMAFGNNERALWLVPLLSGVAGLLLFRRLAERTLRGIAVPLAVALFAFSLALIRYSAEVKQYGVDATVAVGLTLLAFDLRTRDRSLAGLILAGVIGLVVIWFSQAAALVMTGLGAALALAWVLDRDRRTRRALVTTVPLWALAALTAAVVGERSMGPETRAFMREFWRGGFLPLPPSVSRAAPWLWERLVGLFSDSWTLHYPLAPLFAVLALIGVVVLCRQHRDAALMIAAPFVVTLAAAVAQQYPFRTRVVVFLLPSALLAAAAGAGWISHLVARRRNIVAIAIAAAVLSPPMLTLFRSGLPARVENYKPVYAHLQANRTPGDAVYLSFLANNSAIYYGPRYGLQRGEYQLGVCERNDTRAYLRDVDRFRGRKRLWILTKGSPAAGAANEATQAYLRTIGVLRDAIRVESRVSEPLTLELYDLSDPQRLRSASAETFPVPPMPKYPKPGCRDWSGDPREAVGASVSRDRVQANR